MPFVNPKALTPFGTYACKQVAQVGRRWLFGWLLLYLNSCTWLTLGIVLFAYGRNKVSSSFV